MMKTGEDPERDIARKREEWKARLQRSYAERAADTGEEDVVDPDDWEEEFNELWPEYEERLRAAWTNDPTDQG